MKKLGYCCVGCGRISPSHLYAARELSDLVDLVAVVDIIEEKAIRRAKEFGARKYYLSVDEAFLDPQIDIVDLCLPHYLHCPIAVQAAENGKHVLVEKPMSITVEEAEKMISAAEKNGVTLMVGQSRRFHRAVLESMKRLKEIGTLIHVITIWNTFVEKPPTEWWRSNEKAGGLLISLNGSHAVDYILWLLGQVPQRVYAETYRNNPEWEGEDEVSIVMGFKEGVVADVHLSFNDRVPIYERHIVGTKGTMHLYGEKELWVNGKKIISEDMEPFITGTRAYNFILQLKEFVTSINEGRTPMCSGYEVKKVIEVLEAARKSAATHSVITLSE